MVKKKRWPPTHCIGLRSCLSGLGAATEDQLLPALLSGNRRLRRLPFLRLQQEEPDYQDSPFPFHLRADCVVVYCRILILLSIDPA